ncbi:myosin-11-like [Tigriopus californicus]|nr:myosin-11-like [Tigriopus californicus]
MSFSRAPVKRYYDDIPNLPGPMDYDPKELDKKGKGVADVRSCRFPALAGATTPGPGQYDTTTKTFRARQPDSLNSSNASNESDVFRTPRPTLATPRSVIKVKRSTSNSSLGSVAPDLWREKCQDLEKQIKVLEAALADALKAQDESAHLEDVIQELRAEITNQKEELEAKLNSLQDLVREREQMKQEWLKLEEEKTGCDQKIQTLKQQLELLTQDNENHRQKLMDEQRSLEEKSTFLHFTQEQLNFQLDLKDDLVRQLEAETGRLKEEVASLHHRLESEMKEMSEAYSKDNAEALEAFKLLKHEKDKLVVDKFMLVSQAALENAKLVDENMTLLGERNDLKIKIEDLNEELKSVREEMEELRAQIDVHENDKQVLEDEMQSILKEKSNIALDLAEVTREKMKVDQDLAGLEEDYTTLLTEVKTVKDSLRALEVARVRSQDDQEAQNSQILVLSETLKKKEDQVTVLQGEVQELEMKTNSLQGSLSAALFESANLETEKQDLTAHVEKMEASVHDYITKCQGLEIECEGLSSSKADLNETCIILENRMKVERNEKMEALQELEQLKSDKQKLALELQGSIDELIEANESLTQAQRDLEQTNEELDIENQSLRALLEQTKTDLETKEREQNQLIEMNQELSSQVSENLRTLKTVQDHCEELEKRNQELKSDLQNEQAGFESELQNHWAAEDEILQLRAELDRIHSEREESLEKMGLDAKEREGLERQIQTLSTDLSNMESERDNALNDLNVAQADLEERGKILHKVITNSKENASKIEQYNGRLKASENALREAHEKLNDMADYQSCFDKVMAEKNEAEAFLQQYIDEAEESSRAIQSMKDEAAEREKTIDELKQELNTLAGEVNPIREESKSFKDKYEALLAMIEPYKDQLETFEMERNALMSQNQATHEQLKELAIQQAQQLGHQNHKQKINLLVKIKGENVEMKKEMTKLHLELDKLRRAHRKYETTHPNPTCCKAKALGSSTSVTISTTSTAGVRKSEMMAKENVGPGPRPDRNSNKIVIRGQDLNPGSRGASPLGHRNRK